MTIATGASLTLAGPLLASLLVAAAALADDDATPLTATAKPKFSVAAGTYQFVQVVTITDKTRNATLYYTTDGSTPTTASTRYSTPIAIGESETLKAIAVAARHTTSAVESAAYTISCPTLGDGCVPALATADVSGESAFTLYADFGTATGTASGLGAFGNSLIDYAGFAAHGNLPYLAANTNAVYFPLIGDGAGNLWAVAQQVNSGGFSTSIAIAKFAGAAGGPASLAPTAVVTLPATPAVSVDYLVFDRDGNLWADEINLTANDGTASIVEYTAASSYLATGTVIAYSGSGGEAGGCEGAALAVTFANHLEALESVSDGAGGCTTQMREYNAAGTPVTSIYFPNGYTGNSGSIAIDAGGDLWVISDPSDCSSSTTPPGCTVPGAIYEVNSSGLPVQTLAPPATPSNQGNYRAPVFDANGNLWFGGASTKQKWCTSTATQYVYELAAGSTAASVATSFTGSCAAPLTILLGLAITPVPAMLP
jgi:hypothetical protein